MVWGGVARWDRGGFIKLGKRDRRKKEERRRRKEKITYMVQKRDWIKGRGRKERKKGRKRKTYRLVDMQNPETCLGRDTVDHMLFVCR